ncbi:MAG TPA: glycosyltransferase family 39 protein [Gemmatimonadales bacterium]|nr:glycosyltransferase family 39 protein [Gemmatimonadales bacterium]
MSPPPIRALILATAALVVVTRLPILPYQDAINDEAYYAVVGGEMVHGGTMYRDATDRKPPLLFTVYWGAFRLAEYPDWPAIHLLSLGWVLATMAVLYALGSLLFTPVTGVVAAFLYGAFQPLLRFSNLAFNGELLMNLPICAGLWLLFKEGRRTVRWEPLAGGALVGAAALLKQPAGVALLPFCLYCLHPEYRRSRSYSTGTGWGHAPLVLAGFALVLAGAALILRHFGILADAWYWSVVDHDVPHGALDPAFWQRAGRAGVEFVLASGPLLIGAGLSLFSSPDLWNGRKAERDALIVLALASMLGVSASGRFFSHYFIQLLPALVLLAAPALAELWRVNRASARSWLRGVTLGWTTASVLFAFGATLKETVVAPHGPSEVATWLRANGSPEDRLFVWGQSPHTYYRADMRPASRYIAYYPLTGYAFGVPENRDPKHDTSNRIVPGAWDSLAEDFTRHLPRYIVDVDGVGSAPRYPIAHFPYLDTLIRTDYELAFRARDGLIYTRRN